MSGLEPRLAGWGEFAGLDWAGAGIAFDNRPAREIVLVGSTVDDAITRVEKFLDDALLADERRLRVVHGHGTGRLRDAMRTFFKAHPLVASVAPAADNEGGEKGEDELPGFGKH